MRGCRTRVTNLDPRATITGCRFSTRRSKRLPHHDTGLQARSWLSEFPMDSSPEGIPCATICLNQLHNHEVRSGVLPGGQPEVVARNGSRTFGDSRVPGDSPPSTPNSVRMVIICPKGTPASSAALPSEASPFLYLSNDDRIQRLFGTAAFLLNFPSR